MRRGWQDHTDPRSPLLSTNTPLESPGQEQLDGSYCISSRYVTVSLVTMISGSLLAGLYLCPHRASCLQPRSHALGLGGGAPTPYSWVSATWSSFSSVHYFPLMCWTCPSWQPLPQWPGTAERSNRHGLRPAGTLPTSPTQAFGLAWCSIVLP